MLHLITRRLHGLVTLGVITLILIEGITCIPTTLQPLPKGVTHVGHDEKNKRYVALWDDGSLYRRFSQPEMRSLMSLSARGPTSCTPLSVDDLKKCKYRKFRNACNIFNLTLVPGFAKIDQYFKDTYGSGSKNIVTNPPEVLSFLLHSACSYWPLFQYLDRPASLCADDKPVPVGLGFYSQLSWVLRSDRVNRQARMHNLRGCDRRAAYWDRRSGPSWTYVHIWVLK